MDCFLLFIKPFVAEGAEAGFVVDKGTELCEALHIPFAIEPKAEISSFGVFLVQVVQTALIERLKVGIGK